MGMRSSALGELKPGSTQSRFLSTKEEAWNTEMRNLNKGAVCEAIGSDSVGP